MTPRCTVCSHPDFAQIDEALVAGTPVRDIAGQFGVSKSAVDRHRSEHLPAALGRAHGMREIGRADALLAKLLVLEEIARGALDRAVADGADRDRDARGWHRELRQTVELLARVTGEFGAEVQVNITNEWQEISIAVMTALQPFPEARLAVVKALEPEVDR